MKARTLLRAALASALAPVLAVSLATVASAQDKKLEVGHTAPGLDVEIA